MALGIAITVFGYSLMYWGLHHMPGTKRYSMWQLLGIPYITKQNYVPGQKVQFK